MLGAMPGPWSALIKHEPCFDPENFTALQNSQIRHSPAWAECNIGAHLWPHTFPTTGPEVRRAVSHQGLSVELDLLGWDHGCVWFVFWTHCPTCRILVPQLEMEHLPPGVKAQSLDHWTAEEVPESMLCISL